MCLLNYLGVGPNSNDPWPLHLQSRTLAVLIEVILLQQQQERESSSGRNQSEAAILSIWTRFMITLKHTILDFDNNVADYEGLFIRINSSRRVCISFRIFSLYVLCIYSYLSI